MGRKKSTPRISATAKAEVTAKAVIQRKKTVSENIPPDVTRAKASAWLDLISPLTEWAGLKGDELRHKRELLRLQREDVLAEIVSRARRQIESDGRATKPVPNKFIVPFLEQASLEDPGSELVDMWASLLASAASDYASHHVHFVSIISQLSAKQGNILRGVTVIDNAEYLSAATNTIYVDFQSSRISETIKSKVRGIYDLEGMKPVVEGLFDLPGIVVDYVFVEDGALFFDFHGGVGDDEVDYSILEAVVLIRRVDTNVNIRPWVFRLSYYHLTWLGYYFAEACGLVKANEAGQTIDEPSDA